MVNIACVAASCVHSTLASYEETKKTTLTAPKQTNQTQPMISWEENCARLRRLAQSTQETQETETDSID